MASPFSKLRGQGPKWGAIVYDGTMSNKKNWRLFFEWIFVKPLTLLPSHKRRTYLPQKTTQGHILFFFFFIFSGFLWLHSSLCPQIWPAHRIPFYTHHLNSIICAPLLSQRRFIVNMQCQKINESSSRKQLQTRLYKKVVCFHIGWLSACP